MLKLSGKSYASGRTVDVHLLIEKNVIDSDTETSKIRLCNSRLPWPLRAALNWLHCSLPIRARKPFRVEEKDMSVSITDSFIIITLNLSWPVDEQFEIQLLRENYPNIGGSDVLSAWRGM